MGSKLSPMLADIFVYLMEMKVIKPYLANKTVLYYRRFVDDIFVIIKKGESENILSAMNKFNRNLKFTKDQSYPLPFLDTQVYIENGVIEHRFYKKNYR